MRQVGPWLKRFYRKAYEDNVTGLAGMVAYNMLLAVLPLGLIALFVAGRVLESAEFEQAVLEDLQRIFPTAAESTLAGTLERIQNATARTGVAALVASVWIGASFFGALDTAFCRIYHVRCRSWLQQKRFALAMLAVVLLFMASTIAVPTLQSILLSGADRLPLGLAEVRELVFGLTLVAGLTLLFVTLTIIYWTVPNEPVPWSAVWPGALLATLAIGIVDYAFPAYLSGVSTIARFGTTLVFVVIVLLWFYAVALIILGGAVTNAIRFEDVAARRGAPEPAADPATPAPEPAPTAPAAPAPAPPGARPS